MLSAFPSRPATTAVVHSAQLSPARRRLVSLIRDVHFGRIEELQVRQGQPLFSPPPRVIRTVKVAGSKATKPSQRDDAELKRESLDVLRELEALGDGVVRRIEVAHGVPLFMEIVDPQPAV
jgi:hypothetical protein